MDKISAKLFLELISDPTKYRVYLEKLEAERERLEKVVETVGKATELEALRKKVEKQEEKLDKDFSKRLVDLEASYSTRATMIQEQLVRAEKMANDATKSMQAAEEKEQQTIALQNSFAGRENAIKKKELAIASESERLSALMTEYEEKVAKLRSVMA